MVDDGFELFVTVDQNLPYEQNVERLPLAICVLCGVDNRRETLAKLIPKLFLRLVEGNLQNVMEIS
jgi:hypothetical protein